MIIIHNLYTFFKFKLHKDILYRCNKHEFCRKLTFKRFKKIFVLLGLMNLLFLI